ncbi:PAF acetylhydrolase family protein [Aspergillus floccosus]
MTQLRSDPTGATASPSDKYLLLAALVTQLLPSIGAVSFPATGGLYNASIATAQLVDHHPTYSDNLSLSSRPSTKLATFEDEQYAQAGIPAGAFGLLTLQTCMPCPSSDSSRRVKGPKFPLILFSPGLGNSRLLYGAMAQQLSSTGYIVVTIDHPYDAGIVTFPNNTTVLAANITTNAEIIADLNIRVRDVSFVLDQLYIPSVISRLILRRICGLDTSKVGIYVYSLGGGTTAAEAMLSGPRLLGGVNLDGTFFGSVIDRGLDKPFILMAHEGKNLTTNVSWGALWPKLKGFKRRFMLRGSTHGTFTDLAVAADLIGLREEFPAQTAAFLGSIDGGRAHQAIVTYTSRFFDFVLKGKKRELLDRSTMEFPEVTAGEN